MVDRVSPSQRSAIMSRIRKHDSQPERLMHAALRSVGVRFSTYSRLPGTPDIVIKAARTAVFVHGCYWHGCPRHYRPAKSRTEYWHAKIAGNKRRDARNSRRLRQLGWAVLTVWECDAQAKAITAARRIARAVEKRLDQ